MFTNRNSSSRPRNRYRPIFNQSCSLMNAVQPWMVQMDVDDWGMATMFQQGCDLSEEVAQSCCGLESRGVGVGCFRVPEAVKMTSIKYAESQSDHFLPWYKKQNRVFHKKTIFMNDNAPSDAARNSFASLAATGIKEDKLMVWPHPLLTSTPLRTTGESSSKRSMRAGGSSHPKSVSKRLF